MRERWAVDCAGGFKETYVSWVVRIGNWRSAADNARVRVTHEG